MKLALALLALVPACAGMDAEPAAAAPKGPRPVRKLVEAARYARLAVPVAALGGERWMGAVDHDLVEYDGDREVRRFAGSAAVHGGYVLRALPSGGWVAGSSLLAADGAVRWSGSSWAQRYGRFGSPKAIGWSADGSVAIVDGADSPSACRCDRERGTSGGSSGALVRLTFTSEGAPIERVLIEHADHRELHVAASARWVAAAEAGTLSVWPAVGDGAPITVAIATPTFDALAWAGDRYLIATRYLELDRYQIVVLDREAGYAASAQWAVEGQIRDLAIRPGDGELAVALTRYRATDVVHVDERRVEVYALDGTRRARVDTGGYPSSLSWSPKGDALLVAVTGNQPSEQAVIRFAAK